LAYIRIARADIGGEGLGLFLRLAGKERPLARAVLRRNTISLVDDLLDMERALQLSATGQAALVIRRGGQSEPVLVEPLLFHHSFFAPIMDYSRAFPHIAADGSAGDAGGEAGGESGWARPGMLAVFTHAHDDNAMLRFWEAHYARLAPNHDLFVIDHGSSTSPRLLLHPETNVVRLPRGATDHADMARFCGAFQRFLLSQYRWVLHTDADELFIHQNGNAALLARLAQPEAAGILAPERAVDVIQHLGREGALRLGEPLGPQRSLMLPNDLYRKPALASEPASWLQGFHQVYEETRVRVEPGLWLLHLQAADFDLLLRKNEKWNERRQSGADRRISPQRRPDAPESLRAWYAAALADERLASIPPELRRLF